MQVMKAVGREAAAKKYDLLSAMMAYALAGDKHRQRLVMRLMALMTARYNWQRDELTIGQREIARLWCVDERTVKRDMARLRNQGWVDVKQQGARGRVSVLGLNIDRILLDTRPQWSNVGPDFVERLTGRPELPVDNVVPLHRAPVAEPAGQGVWSNACKRLSEEDRVIYDAWFATLTEVGLEGDCLVLVGPTRFHATYVQTHLNDRMRIAVRRSHPEVVRIRVISP